jgi:glyoxylase-like metal-dependent hydrolase (beta-lactamase superfamily II)
VKTFSSCDSLRRVRLEVIMGIYLRQLRAGRDFAKNDPFAKQMANFVYLIGDEIKRECMIVDPAWDIDGILDYIGSEDMTLIGALVTHYHPDHVGGDIFGHQIEGIAKLNSLCSVRIHANAHEIEGIRAVTGLSKTDLKSHTGGEEIKIGDSNLRLLHTPGHTPGSQCFLVDSRLISGDTLFIGGCGRVDLPGGDAQALYHSLTQVLGKLPDDTILYPGHDYSDINVSTLGEQKSTNFSMRVSSLDNWLKLMTR